MPIFTPRGLKIRLDPDGLNNVLAPAGHALHLEDAYLDLELWVHLPEAVAGTAAIVAALLTQSPLGVVLSALAGFCLAAIVQVVRYSPVLRVLFPQVLGAPFIALPLSVLLAIWLYRNGHPSSAITQLLVVVACWRSWTDFVLFALIPVRAVVRRIARVPLGDVELAFIAILDRQAQRAGFSLDWSQYTASRSERGDRGA